MLGSLVAAFSIDDWIGPACSFAGGTLPRCLDHPPYYGSRGTIEGAGGRPRGHRGPLEGEVKEERLAAAMAENVHNAVQAEAARLRGELEGAGHSLPFFLPTNPSLWAMFATFSLDAPCSGWWRVEEGGPSLDRLASRCPGGGE
jgi:hypothetical protein